MSERSNYATAELTVTVDAVNEYPPVVTSSLLHFEGFVYENAPKGTFITNKGATKTLKFLARDPDQVNITAL